jgi:hypothetical protein
MRLSCLDRGMYRERKKKEKTGKKVDKRGNSTRRKKKVEVKRNAKRWWRTELVEDLNRSSS